MVIDWFIEVLDTFADDPSPFIPDGYRLTHEYKVYDYEYLERIRENVPDAIDPRYINLTTGKMDLKLNEKKK